MRRKGNTDIQCETCGETKKYWARNLCRACWTRHRAEKKLAAHPNLKTLVGDQRHQAWIGRLNYYNQLREAGYIQTEIADITGWSLSTVKNMTGRAKKAGLPVFRGNNAKRKNADKVTPS